jgi:hypothetical protein
VRAQRGRLNRFCRPVGDETNPISVLEEAEAEFPIWHEEIEWRPYPSLMGPLGRCQARRALTAYRRFDACSCGLLYSTRRTASATNSGSASVHVGLDAVRAHEDA